MSPRLRLHGTAGWRHGASSPWQPLERKHAALLAWLWLQGATPRSRLAGLLWPEVAEDRARGNLRQRLLKLRQDAGDLVVDRGGLLSLSAAVVVEPPDPAGAPLLAALDFDDCEAFNRWLDAQHEAVRAQRKRDLLARVRAAVSSGGGQRLDDALYAADQLLQTDRESEEAYRVLMEVYTLRGDHAAALSAWDRCRDMLRQLYGVLPSAATQQLGQTILAADAQAQATQRAWAPTPSSVSQLPAAVLRPPQLVGREQALHALAAGWLAGHVLLVAGEAGVGKSRLLADWQAQLARQVAAQTATQTATQTAAKMAPHGGVVAAAARPGDALLPYASLSRLLLAAIDRAKPPLDSAHALQAARLLPRLANLTGQTVAPVRSAYERTQALLALARLLGDCVQAGCLAFVLDDLQFADPASLAALGVLAEPVEPASPSNPSNLNPIDTPRTALRFALALRADEAGPEATALLAALAATQRCTRIDLLPLSAEHAAALLASLRVPGLDAAGWAPQIWRQVGGNPAFLLESVKLLLSGGAAVAANGSAGDQGTLPLPATIEAVIQRRIELLSPRARTLAQLAAIAGSGYSVPLAAAALACQPLELSEPLRELELRQVFYGRQFVHDVIASVTERSVPAAVAEFMHRFVAEHLSQHGADAAQIASHWQACAEWRRAGQCWRQAAQAARAAALANEHADLLDRAIAALERDPAAHDTLFDALDERASAFESQGHEGLRPQLISRLQALARSEAQHLAAFSQHCGWLTNLAQPVDEAQALAGIPRAQAVGRPDLAWELARMLGWQWAMSNRADDALALLQVHQPWVAQHAKAGSLAKLAAYHLARSAIFAFGDRLTDAVPEATLALQASTAEQDWPNALPAMSNLGVMHYWRGEYPAAQAVLSQAREQRERLYGSSGSGIKIDIHLGAVLYELGRSTEATSMLQGALAEMATWPDNNYRRTECLLAANHLAQMWIALGQADAAAAVLAQETTGVAERFYGRRLTLRLRWQRVFAGGAGAANSSNSGLRDELQALAARLASPFNRALMLLELARHQPPDQALAACRSLHDSSVALHRPGLQLHAATLAAQAALQTGQLATAQTFAQAAQALQARCAPFDMDASEVAAVLAAVIKAVRVPAH